jgi:hypothetical protein
VQQRAEVAQRVGAQRRVLRVHEARKTHLLLARDEMVVPEERHPFGERRRRCKHLLHPPRTQLQAMANLQPLERLALFGGCVFGARIAQRRGLGGPVGRWRAGGRARIAQQFRDRLLAGEPGEGADFGLGRSKSGTHEQVARVVEAHRRGRAGGGSGDQRQRGGGSGKETSRHGDPWLGGSFRHQRPSLRAC